MKPLSLLSIATAAALAACNAKSPPAADAAASAADAQAVAVPLAVDAGPPVATAVPRATVAPMRENGRSSALPTSRDEQAQPPDEQQHDNADGAQQVLR